MRGHIRQRGAGWVVVVDHGRDEAGRRKQKWYSGYKTKKEAEQALTKTLAAKDNGERLPEAPTKLTYGTFLLEKWLPHLRKPRPDGQYRGSPLTPSMPTSSTAILSPISARSGCEHWTVTRSRPFTPSCSGLGARYGQANPHQAWG